MPKVLLVADATWVANEVEAALSLGEWELTPLHDPREITDMVSTTQPDVVIADMQVGSMGGMALIREIRQAFEGPLRPRTVLLLDRSADAFIARRAGADAWVLKPINAADLREAVAPAGAPISTSKED